MLSVLDFRALPDGSVQEVSATTPSGSEGKPSVIVYKRVPLGRVAALSEYVGEYVSDEVAASWCLLRKGDALVIRRRNVRDRPSQLLLEDMVDAPGGFVEFQRHDGRVTGFLLRNPRVHSVEFTKLPVGQHPLPSPWTCSP